MKNVQELNIYPKNDQIMGMSNRPKKLPCISNIFCVDQKK